ncbi:hypothetical protein DH2020_022200 [Rehmannia glutinosa]|uniref:Shq1 C-terminal domain-containing protein n=1 Tax=Rehmannia glutinosa TaxID=99300 RepID=A0ABR0WGX4_REHGL
MYSASFVEVAIEFCFLLNQKLACHRIHVHFGIVTVPRCISRTDSVPVYSSLPYSFVSRQIWRCGVVHESPLYGVIYERECNGELQQLQPDEESKSKMLDILKRFHEEEDTDSMDEEELDSSFSEETIQKILSGDQISFDDLSAEEKKHFQRAVASGELSKLIEPWDPWWLKPSARYISLSSDGTQLVQPITNGQLAESENNVDSDKQHEIPPGPETPLPPVSKLTASGPSPLLAIHLIDIIYCYCFTLRLYNGDWRADPLESATLLLSVSSVLSQSGQPETVLEALLHCLEQTCSPAYKHVGGMRLGLMLMDDVVRLLYLGGDALVCLLCDMRRIIQTAERELKSEKLDKSRRAEVKSKIKSAERKIYFIMCWVHEQPSEVWSSLAGIVDTEKSSAMEYAESKKGAVRLEEKTGIRAKPLIKEIE